MAGLPAGDITGVNIGDSEQRMLFFVNSSNAPATLFSYDFGTKKATSLVKGLNPEIDPADLVTGEVIRYKSFDGMEIPACSTNPKMPRPPTSVRLFCLSTAGRVGKRG
jgi:dipeptidyl aminopeptidase/acylaminoacyl peptidase